MIQLHYDLKKLKVLVMMNMNTYTIEKNILLKQKFVFYQSSLKVKIKNYE